MSTYQYHEWQTVDGVLSAAQQNAVRKLSSHIDVGAGRAVVTYNWGDFRHDPRQVLLDYFDAYLYLASWGSKCLMFRFPRGVVDDELIAPYLIDKLITWETQGAFQVLAMDFDSEKDAGWIEEDIGLASFIALRAELMAGDLRLLYLAWLKGMTLDWYDDPDEEAPTDPAPPIPPGLQALSPALARFAAFFAVDRQLIAAAAELSGERPAISAPDYPTLVADLSRGEADDFLAAIAAGNPGALHALRRRLQAAAAPQPHSAPAAARTYDQLRQRADELAAAERLAAAEAARRQHAAAMEALALRQEAAWEEMVEMLDHDRRSAAVYDRATELLVSLAQLAEYQGKEEQFRSSLADLADRYATRKALLSRWRERGLL